MKKPSLNELTLDSGETKRIRSGMAKQKSVKITINIDSATLAKFRALAEKTGVPYQRLINRSLSDSLVAEAVAQSRLERIERELKALKKKLSA